MGSFILMRRRVSYFLLGLVIFIAAMISAGLYSASREPLQQLNYNEETDTRIRSLIDRLMAQETYSLTHEDWGPSMQALADIGPQAVPRLIETVDRARETYISRNLAAGLPPSDFSIRVEPLIVQTRAVMVLGRIGDKRALPILLDIQAHHDLCPLRCEVDDAIKSIKENQGTS